MRTEHWRSNRVAEMRRGEAELDAARKKSNPRDCSLPAGCKGLEGTVRRSSSRNRAPMAHMTKTTALVSVDTASRKRTTYKGCGMKCRFRGGRR